VSHFSPARPLNGHPEESAPFHCEPQRDHGGVESYLFIFTTIFTPFLGAFHVFFTVRGVTSSIMATETKTLSDSQLEVHGPEIPRLGEHPQGILPYIQSVPFRSNNGLKVSVLFTDYEATRESLMSACSLAARLNAIIEVVAAEVVPYPMPLDSPPSTPFRCLIRSFEASLDEYSVKAELRVFLCRNQLEALKHILKPNSPILMAIGRSNPIRDEMLARNLRYSGYDVIQLKVQ
jgi:hypothetical protein